MALTDVIAAYQTGVYRVDRRPNGSRASGHYVPVPGFEQDVLAVVGDDLTLTAHGLATGYGPVWVSSSGDVPDPLDATVAYWVIVVDVNTIQLASSFLNAIDDVPVALTDAGSGTVHVGTHFMMPASIQPNDDDTLQDEPDSQYNKDTITIFSTTELMYGRQPGYEMDIITYRDVTWRCFKGSFYGILSNHYVTTAEKVDVP